MYQQQPYGGPPPVHDPQAGTQIYQAPAHLNPNQPRSRMSPPLIFSLLAFLLACAALWLVTTRLPHAGASAEVPGLTSQVRTLQHQHGQDTTQYQNLAAQYKSLSIQYSALSGTVKGMATTVHNLSPYADAQCSAAMQGPGGAYTAAIPCKPK